MAGQRNQKKSKWIERIQREGAIPLLDQHKRSNGWSSPPVNAFMIRGSNYFTTKVKIPAGDYLLKPLGFDWIKSSTKICDILNHPNNRVKKVIDNEFANNNGNRPFIWAFNLQLPTKDNYSAVAYFTTKEPITKGSLMQKFLKGDDVFRNSRLKMIANIVNGPWIVRKAVGEQAICIIGRALSCKYCVTKNFVEVDVDVGSSMVATAIVHLAFGYVTKLTVDLAFLIESQDESELPEKLLRGFRFSNLYTASARSIEPYSVSSNGSLQKSLSKRLWNSIGNILSGSQEDDSSSGSQNFKTGVDHIGKK